MGQNYEEVGQQVRLGGWFRRDEGERVRPISGCCQCSTSPLTKPVKNILRPGHHVMSSPQPIRALEFYSGIGGLHYALLKSRPEAEVLKAFDWDPTSCQVYHANHGPIIYRVHCG